MKRNGIAVVVVTALLLLLPATLLLADARLPEYYRDSYYAELGEMYERLRTVQGQKMVLIGGSNIAFGVHTEQMEQQLETHGYSYQVCSFGLYAAVGTAAMLELSEPELQEGDIVILALEPSSETLSDYFGAKAFLKCARENPALLCGLKWDNQVRLLPELIPELQERCALFQEGQTLQAEDVYAKASFNERCDMVWFRAGNMMPLGYDASDEIDLEQVNVETAFAERVQKYAKRLERKGVQVWLSFSPVNRMAVKKADGETLWKYSRYYTEMLGCRLISDPEDYIMESGWFYDSNYHLNTAGAQVRTEYLIRDILTALGCTDQTEVSIPELPGRIAAITSEEEGDSGCFTFLPVITDGEVVGYYVNGLTEDGKKQEELRLPSTHDGQPVAGFTEAALDEADSLKTLILPETVTVIPDGLFYPCKKLEWIYFLHQKCLCRVTEKTFAHEEPLKLAVPEEAMQLYQNGDGCESNDWEPYLDQLYPF